MAVEAAEKGDFFRFIYYMPHEMETKNFFSVQCVFGDCTEVRGCLTPSDWNVTS
jgi:hypothetical protein